MAGVLDYPAHSLGDLGKLPKLPEHGFFMLQVMENIKWRKALGLVSDT